MDENDECKFDEDLIDYKMVIVISKCTLREIVLNSNIMKQEMKSFVKLNEFISNTIKKHFI